MRDAFELSIEEVALLARAVELTISNEDLGDVAHRLNILLSGMARITHPDLDAVEPLPLIGLGEFSDGSQSSH